MALDGGDARPVDGHVTRRRYLIASAYVAASLMYVVWSLHMPVSILTTSRLDDALFWTNAQHIVDGDWLGSYTNSTLAKGPGFPIVLAVNHVLGTPITLLLALLYLTSCWLVTRSVARAGLNAYFSLAAFWVLLFLPAVVPTRVIRDDAYASLSLMVVAGAVYVIVDHRDGARTLAVCAGAGLALGLFWVTREDGLWIVPGLLVLGLLGLARARHDRGALRRAGVRVGTLLLAALVLVGAVGAINLAYYGRFLITDVKDPAFSRALKALNSVQVGQDTAFIPVSRAMRARLYEVSPSFAELADTLDGRANSWMQSGCSIYPATCGDFAGGWWMWALRDAAASRGYYSSPSAAADFYDRISTEIEAACESGAITCRSSPVPFMPNLTPDQIRNIPATLWSAVQLLTMQLPVDQTGPSAEPLMELRSVREFLGNPRTTPALSEPETAASGWYYAPGGGWITLACTDPESGQVDTVSPQRLDSPDVAEFLSDPSAAKNRFAVTVQASRGCRLVPDGRNTRPLELSSVVGTAPREFDLEGGARLFVDSASTVPDVQAGASPLLTSVEALYRVLLPVLGLIGIACFLAGFLLRVARRRLPYLLFGIAGAFWVLVASRVVLLVLVDVSSFPAVNSLYMSPAFPLFVLACACSIQSLWDVVGEFPGRHGPGVVALVDEIEEGAR